MLAAGNRMAAVVCQAIRGGMRLEQEKKQRWRPGWAGAAALGLLLACLLPGGPVWAALTRPDAVTAAAVEGASGEVIPLGRAVGIKLFSDGVLVVGLSSIDTAEGPAAPGRTSGLKAGDVITHIDQTEVNTIEEVQKLVAQKRDAPMTLQVRREGADLQLSAQAVRSQAGAYQLGVWLRDSMAGIGTMTFYDPQSGVFAALGHGINDVDTAKLMPLETGSIMEASVSDVKRGRAGGARRAPWGVQPHGGPGGAVRQHGPGDLRSTGRGAADAGPGAGGSGHTGAGA